MAELAEQAGFRIPEKLILVIAHQNKRMAAADRPGIDPVMAFAVFPMTVVTIAGFEIFQISGRNK